MSTVTATTSGSSTANPYQAASTSETQDRFLSLLVAQMKNQDPLNPLDNAQVTTQLAQISTVSGIDKLNASVSTLSGQLNSAQSLQAASLIGHAVLSQSNELYFDTTQVSGGIELSQDASSVTIKIADANGQTVKTLQLNDQKAGIVDYAWDGTSDTGSPLPAGLYNVSVSAASNNMTVEATPLAYATVDSITLASSGALANLHNLSPVYLSSIRQIL